MRICYGSPQGRTKQSKNRACYWAFFVISLHFLRLKSESSALLRQRFNGNRKVLGRIGSAGNSSFLAVKLEVFSKQALLLIVCVNHEQVRVKFAKFIFVSARRRGGGEREQLRREQLQDVGGVGCCCCRNTEQFFSCHLATTNSNGNNVRRSNDAMRKLATENFEPSILD